MAETVETKEKTTETKPKTKDDRVAVTPPRGEARGESVLFIGVNGVNYVLPRGKTSMVPPKVAKEYNRSERAKDRFANTSSKLLEQGK